MLNGPKWPQRKRESEDPHLVLPSPSSLNTSWQTVSNVWLHCIAQRSAQHELMQLSHTLHIHHMWVKICDNLTEISAITLKGEIQTFFSPIWQLHDFQTAVRTSREKATSMLHSKSHAFRILCPHLQSMYWYLQYVHRWGNSNSDWNIIVIDNSDWDSGNSEP